MAGQTKVIVSNNIANIKKQINVLEAERSRLIDNPPRGVKPGKNPDNNYGEDHSMGRTFFYTEGAKTNRSVIDSYIKKVEALDRRIQDLKKRLNTNPDMLRHSADSNYKATGMHWAIR